MAPCFPRGRPTTPDDATAPGVATLLALLDGGADPNLADDTGCTPLFYAAAVGSAPLCRSLAARGAHADVANEADSTPLMAAAGAGHIACAVALLKECGVSPRGVLLAAETGNEELLAALLDAGVPADELNEFGQGPLHTTADAVAVPLLVRHGAAVELRDQDGNTPLAHQCALGEAAIVQALLELGANYDAKNDLGHSPLYNAAASGHPECVALLEAAGAKMDVAGTQDRFKNTAWAPTAKTVKRH